MQQKKPDPRKKVEQAKKALRYTMISRLAKAMAHEYSIQGEFKNGYRNKEDISNLPASTLVVGSQNVLTNSSDQVQIRTGYQLDGSAGSQNTYGTDSSYDFNTRGNGIQNLRKWGTTLQCRYKNPGTSAISWVTLLSNLSATNPINGTDFWDFNTELKNLCLFVNGDNVVREWSGGVASYASSTPTSITVQGTKSLATLNFYTKAGNLGKMQVLINGTTYRYTGAAGSPTSAYNQTPTTNKIAVTPTQWNAQLFTTGAAAASIFTAAVVVNAASGPNYPSANFTASIYTDNAGVPGTLVGTAVSSSIPGAYSAGDFTVTFTFNVAVSAATNYHFVISSDQPSNITVYTGAVPALGTTISTNSGSTWAAQNGYLNLVVTENDAATLTFTGVTPDPSIAGIASGDAIVQLPAIGTAGITNAPLSGIDIIGTFRNQVYYGQLTNQTIYISKVNQYSDCTVSSPRLPTDGASATLDAPPTAFIPQSDAMYVSAGRDYWYKSNFVLSADLTKETFQFNRLKTSAGQGARSQGYMTKVKNSIMYISYEPIINSFGPVRNIYQDVQVVNVSDPIKNDINAYTYTNIAGHAYYANYFVYFSIPALGIVRVWNVLRKYWEAPQVLPFGRFYQTGDGNLYAHSALTDESYQCFVAGLFNDNGNPINAIAAFPYMAQEGAQASQKKFFNKFFTEGYMSTNTILTLGINYDFGGYSGTYAKTISGANRRKTFNHITDGSLGENPLGSQPIGSILNLPATALVPKFRSIDTFVPVNNFEYQVVYSSNDVDQNWSLLRFGPAITSAKDNPVEIMD